MRFLRPSSTPSVTRYRSGFLSSSFGRPSHPRCLRTPIRSTIEWSCLTMLLSPSVGITHQHTPKPHTTPSSMSAHIRCRECRAGLESCWRSSSSTSQRSEFIDMGLCDGLYPPTWILAGRFGPNSKSSTRAKHMLMLFCQPRLEGHDLEGGYLSHLGRARAQPAHPA